MIFPTIELSHGLEAKVSSLCLQVLKDMKIFLRCSENVIMQLLKQFDILRVRKFFLKPIQIPPDPTEAHFQLALFTDEGNSGKADPTVP